MVASNGGKMIVNSGKWSCGVCGKGVHASSFKCTVCKSRYSNGALMYMVTCRRCKRCESGIQETEDPVMNGETYGCLKRHT